MSEAHVFAIGILLAWMAGIRAYLTVFGVGIAGYFGWLDLPQALEATSSPWVLGVSAAMSPDGELGAGMLAAGAGTALVSHALKAGSRALLNTSPEPVSNWTASVAEDTAVIGGLALVWSHPWIALAILITVGVGVFLVIWWLWRKVFRGVSRLLTSAESSPPTPAS